MTPTPQRKLLEHTKEDTEEILMKGASPEVRAGLIEKEDGQSLWN